MTLYWKLQSNRPDSTGVVCANAASVSAYVLEEGMDLGGAPLSPLFSRTTDSRGTRVTGASLDSREMMYAIGVSTATTRSVLVDNLNALIQEVDDCTRWGGVLTIGKPNITALTRFKVAAGKVGNLSGRGIEAQDYHTVQVSLVCDPYGYSDGFDFGDSFSVNSYTTAGIYNLGGSDWTADAGALTNIPIVGGVVTASLNLTTQNRIIHTAIPHLHGDCQVQIKHTTGASVTNYEAGVILKRIDASNYLRIYVTAASNTLRIDKVVATSATNLANAAATPAVSTAYWIVGRIEGNVLYAEHWTTLPSPLGTPTQTASYALSTSEASTFGASVNGRTGFLWTPIGAAATLDDYTVSGFLYKGAAGRTLPEELPLNRLGGLTGSTDAVASVAVSATGGTAPVSMLLGWYPTPPAYNFLSNGGFEQNTQTGWAFAAVTGVQTNNATSLTVVSTASKVYSGTYSGEIVTPASTDSGVTRIVYRRFKKGVTYTVACRVIATGGATTQVRVKLGVSGDIATGSNTALTTGWQQLTTTWTPTADVNLAYFACTTAAATATTFQLDEAMVYEGTTAPASVEGGNTCGIVAGSEASAFGSFWAAANDATYRTGVSLSSTGALNANGILDWMLLPWTMFPDAYGGSEIELSVFARVQIASTQTSATATLSAFPESGTNYGPQMYSEYGSTGRAIKLPSSGTAFRPIYLGKLTFPVDRTTPRRWKLRAAFTNSGAATGTFGLDYLVIVPTRNLALSQTGVAQGSSYGSFIASTNQTTQVVASDLSCSTYDYSGPVSRGPFRNGSLTGARIELDRNGVTLVAWPQDVVIDRTDSASTSAALSYTGAVQVGVVPQQHIARSDT